MILIDKDPHFKFSKSVLPRAHCFLDPFVPCSFPPLNSSIYLFFWRAGGGVMAGLLINISLHHYHKHI